MSGLFDDVLKPAQPAAAPSKPTRLFEDVLGPDFSNVQTASGSTDAMPGLPALPMPTLMSGNGDIPLRAEDREVGRIYTDKRGQPRRWTGEGWLAGDSARETTLAETLGGMGIAGVQGMTRVPESLLDLVGWATSGESLLTQDGKTAFEDSRKWLETFKPEAYRAEKAGDVVETDAQGQITGVNMPSAEKVLDMIGESSVQIPTMIYGGGGLKTAAQGILPNAPKLASVLGYGTANAGMVAPGVAEQARAEALKAGYTPEEAQAVANKAMSLAAPLTMATGGLGEGLSATQGAGANSLVSALLRGIVPDMIAEPVEEAGTSAIGDIAQGRPINAANAAEAGILAALVGATQGGAVAGTEYMANRGQQQPAPASLADLVAASPTLPAVAADGAATPRQGVATAAPPTQPADNELDALLLRNALLGEAAPAAPATPSVPAQAPSAPIETNASTTRNVENVGDRSAQSEPIVGQRARSEQLLAPPAAVPAEDGPMIEKDFSQPRRRANVVRNAPNGRPMDMLEVIAASGGLNRAAWKAEGVDPAEFTRRAGLNYVFRKDGGMTPDELRELMQQEGYLPRDQEGSTPTVDKNDAVDLFDRAFRGGEKIFSEDQGEQVARYREARQQADDEYRAELAGMPEFAPPTDAGQDFDPFADPVVADFSSQIADLTEQAVTMGATDAEIVGAAFDTDTAEDHVAALENIIQAKINAQPRSDTTPAPSNRESVAQPREEAAAQPRAGEFQLQQPAPAEARTEAVAPQSGLFAPPTTREQVTARERAADGERNGLGRDMVPASRGDGELFAGGRPEQTSIGQESVGAPEGAPGQARAALADRLGRGVVARLERAGVLEFDDRSGGTWDGTKIGIGNVAPENALGVLLHEVTHANMLDVLGEQGYERALRDIDALEAAADPVALKAKARFKQHEALGFRRVERADDERIAYMVEEAANTEKLGTKTQEFFRNLFSAFRRWAATSAVFRALEKIGVDRPTLKPADFAAFARKGLDRMVADAKNPESAGLRGKVRELENQLRTDTMTGMKNRRAFDEDEALGWPTVAAIDMDGLGKLNDAVGHEAADKVLKALADTFMAAENDSIRVYRHTGGDELAVRFKNAADADRVMTDLQRQLDGMNVEMDVAGADGVTRSFTYEGIGITYGTGATYEQADAVAGRRKTEREQAGLRQSKQDPGPSRRVRENSPRPGGRREGDPPAVGAQRSVPDQTQTPAFKRWFGDSKVVDANGEPLVVYHGTTIDFDTFDSSKIGSSTGNGGGFWFAESLKASKFYGPKTVPAFVRMTNPMRVTRAEFEDDFGSPTSWAEYAKDEGHDGLILEDVQDGGTRSTVYAVFDPTQIKSATANRGTFDPADPNIMRSIPEGEDAAPAGADPVAPNPGKFSAAQEEAMTKAGMPTDRRTTLTKVADKLRESWATAREAMGTPDTRRQSAADRFHGLRAAEAQIGGLAPEESPYIAARLTTGLPSIMESLMTFGAPKWDGGALTIDTNTVGLLDALKPVSKDIDAWLGWMVGRRAKLLKSQGRENLFTDGDIDALLALAKGKEAEFTAAAKAYLRIKNNVLDVAEQAGLIDPAQRAAWDHAEYVPFYRQEGEQAIGPGTRKGLEGQNSGIRTLRGGTSELSDPLANIVRNFTRLIDSSLKNRAMLLSVDNLGKTMFTKKGADFEPVMIPMDQVKRTLKDQGVSDATIASMPAGALKGVQRMFSIKPPEADNVVRVMRDGKAEYYEVADPVVLRALTAFTVRDPGMARKVLMFAKRLLTFGITTTADFLAANSIRDTASTWVIGDKKIKLGIDAAIGTYKTLVNDDATRQMMAGGGSFIGGNLYGGDVDATAAALRRALRGGMYGRLKQSMSDRDIAEFTKTVAFSPLVLWDKWMQLSSAIENSNRHAVYNAALKAGKPRIQAIYEAKDLMDFSMRGDSELMGFFADVLPFFNARVQGLYKLGRVGADPATRKQVLVRGSMLALASVALWAWNTAMYADGYDELEEWDKDTYWHIAPGTRYHTRIPKPFEIGLLFGTGPERMAQAIVHQIPGGKEGDRPAQSWEALFRAITGTLAVNPIPQAAMPVAEQWANKKFFTGRPIENMSDEKLLPEAREEWYTSDTFKAVSQFGGNETGMSAKRLEHLWNGYTGELGMYLLDASDLAVRKATDAPSRPEMAPTDFPLVGRFYRGDDEPKSTRYLTEFYDLREKAQQVSGTIKAYLDEGDTDRAEKLEQKYEWLLGPRVASKRAKGGVMFQTVREIELLAKDLSERRAATEEIVKSNASPAEKREAINDELRSRNSQTKHMVRRLRASQDDYRNTAEDLE